MRHTKIIATIGPASIDILTIDAMLRAGVDVFRLNFSHGDPSSHEQTIRHIRSVAAALERHVAILQDLSGTKIRTGPLVGGLPLTLVPGDKLEIALGSFPGSTGVVSTTYGRWCRR